MALWQAWEEECGAPQAVPFWATVWPAGQLLARVVQAEPAWVRGQTVLDLGCGSGVAGIAALYAGAARVVAQDIDPVALAIAAQNARANTVELLLQGTPLLHAPCPPSITCILVGDLFYERAAVSALWAWLRTAHRQGVRVLIADASRPFAPTAGVRCLWENAWPLPGPGRARRPGRCGSSRWTPETALRKRLASGLPRVRGTLHGQHALSRHG